MAENQSIAEQAWNNTKAEGDPDFNLIPEPEFRNQLQFRADKAISSGTAITNFEKEVQRLHALEKAEGAKAGEPNAVVDESVAITAPAISLPVEAAPNEPKKRGR